MLLKLKILQCKCDAQINIKTKFSLTFQQAQLQAKVLLFKMYYLAGKLSTALLFMQMTFQTLTHKLYHILKSIYYPHLHIYISGRFTTKRCIPSCPLDLKSCGWMLFSMPINLMYVITNRISEGGNAIASIRLSIFFHSVIRTD